MGLQPNRRMRGVVGKERRWINMKKTICLLLALLLLGGCTGKAAVENKEEKPLPHVTVYAEPTADLSEMGGILNIQEIPTIDGYNSFVSVLSAAVIDGRTNKNLSPISVYLAVAMAAEGARGDTQAELLALLGEDSIESLRLNAENMLKALSGKGRTGELVLANSIWMGMQDKDVTFHEAYLKTLADSYGAEAQTVPFGEEEAVRRIVAWIREKTRDKIKVSDDAMQFDADTLAVLINTIYLKDSWQTPFEEGNTVQGTFYGLDGQQLNVNYMCREDGDAEIVRGDGYLRYSLTLGEVGQMVFVLPDEGVTLESLLGNRDKIEELLHGGDAKRADVNVMVPKFTFQDRTDLEEILMDLGVWTCFTGGADFSGMTNTPAHISRILQESRIGVDEKGVEAAAYTMIALAKGGVSFEPREQVDFHLTRPFLYAIESRDGTVLFIGTVAVPDRA